MANIIGRKREIDELKRLFNKQEAQLVAVYGRRRVGKTFLIREVFKNQFAFYHTGVSPIENESDNTMAKQLKVFNQSLKTYGKTKKKCPTTWMEAFAQLQDILIPKLRQSRQVVFMDELPWMDTPRSGFISAFEHFWNGWGAGQDNLMLIVCGSATSWIQDNLINNYGGLYDRVNAEIGLSPFTLAETEAMLLHQGLRMSRYDIAQLYMAIGGIPMYLSYLQPGLSLAQQIDMLFFDNKAKLKDEFTRLFNSIFKHPEPYEAVIRLLAKNQIGKNRDEIAAYLGIDNGKTLSTILRALEASNFIEKYKPFENDKRHELYRLTDPFCRFYLMQVENTNRSAHWWQENENIPQLNVWRGLAFEQLCLLHIDPIKRALGIGGISSSQSAWCSPAENDEKGMQIDLIIERRDRVVNVCEMKFYNTEFEVTADYEMKLRQRLNRVMDKVSKRQSVQLTLVTTMGLKYGTHSGVFANMVTLDDLFKD